MSRFVVGKKEVDAFLQKSLMWNQEGIAFAYASAPEVLREIIPPQLEVAFPMVGGYVVQIKESNLGGPTMEVGLYVPVRLKRNGPVYSYFLEFIVHGPGAFNSLTQGREIFGTPKKVADSIDMWRIGNKAAAKVVRNGVTLIDVEMDIDGAYNTPAGAMLLGQPGATKSTGTNLFYRYFLERTEDGGVKFLDGQLASNQKETDIASYEAGKLRIKMQSSLNDPLGELEVVQPLGAAFFKYSETRIIRCGKLMDVENIDEIVPYLLTTRYDRGNMGDAEMFYSC